MNPFFRRIAAMFVCLNSVIAGIDAVAEEVDATRFERTVVAEKLIQPMELDIAPDGSIFLIELGGVVKRVVPTTGEIAEVGRLTVTTAQENGLIGLTLDPDFADNGWLYLQYSPPDFSGQYVSRFEFRDGKIDSASERRLFSYQEQRRECCHHAGSLEFGPGGNLFIGTGDNTNPFNDSAGYAPIDQRDDRGPWDAARTAGNTKSYNGKILRIHPEPDGTYSIPEGNLFPRDGSIGHPEIYVMGCRNPWRIQVDQRTGFLYWGDVGPDAGSDSDRGPRGYDEFNQARQAGNFGWPFFIGNNFAYARHDFATGKIGEKYDPLHPQNESVNNTGSRELPPAQPAMVYYPSAASDEFPELATGGRTACAGPIYAFDSALRSTTKFPASYDGALFAYEWSRNSLFAIHMNDSGDLQRIEPFLTDMPLKRPIDLQFDAGGSLYVIEYGETWGVNPDARLVRIDYVSGNRTPRAIAKAVGNVGREPLDVQLSGIDSTDKDGDELRYQWSIVTANESDPQAVPHRKVIATTVDTTAHFVEPGVYTAELEVTDGAGGRSVSSLPIVVGNARPEVEFLSPQTGDFFTAGQPIEYRLIVRDREDGTSDVELSEQDGWHFIDGTAPSRLFVEATPVTAASGDTASNDPPGLALMRTSDCFNCHAMNRTLVGPAFVAIAEKYRNQPHQQEISVKRVREGSTGVWGKVGMLPHTQHTDAEVQQMVQYVFGTQADTARPTAQGFNSVLTITAADSAVRLEATYTDMGRSDIPKLSGMASVTLRSRVLQAEAADAVRGTQKLGSANATGGHFMGGIEHDGYLQFRDLAMGSVARAVVRVTSAGAGGDIEIRRGSPTGPLLGKTTVAVNGSWDAFHDQAFALEPSEGRCDTFVVFKNETQRGGLMNIDSIAFLPAE